MNTIDDLNKQAEQAQAEAEEKIAKAKAEAQEAFDKARELRQQAEKLDREARYEAERIAREAEERKANEVWYAHFVAVREACINKGFNQMSVAKGDNGQPIVTIGKGAVTLRKDYNYSYGYKSKGTPVMSLRLNWDTHIRFPLKKDGTFSYDKIANRIIELHESAVARARRQAKEDSAFLNSKAIETSLLEKFGKVPYEGASYKSLNHLKASVTHSKYVEGKITMSINYAMTEEQAIEFLAMWQELKTKFDEAENK